jgi:surface polysaccharide O-acyltransferase-like enzyme
VSASIREGKAASLPADRLVSLDALRLTTLACIVAYHCLGSVTAASTMSGDSLGIGADRAAWLLSVFQNEVLIALSAFLFSRRRRNLGRTLTWLLEVYLFWTAVYVLEFLVLPTRSATFPFGRAEFVFVAFLGGAKYHLPFFPALAGCLTFIAVAPSLGSPRLWGAIAIGGAYVRCAVEQSVLHSGAPGPEQMLLLQGMAFASYLPFAVLGSQIEPVSARGWTLRSSLDSLGFTLVAGVLIAEGLRQAAADLPTATEALMAGRAAAIVAVLFVSLGLGTRWTPPSPGLRLILARLAELSLTVFLVHPLVIDILARSFFLNTSGGTRVALLFICVLGVSIAFARVASAVLRTTTWHRSPARSGGNRLF